MSETAPLIRYLLVLHNPQDVEHNEKHSLSVRLEGASESIFGPIPASRRTVRRAVRKQKFVSGHRTYHLEDPSKWLVMADSLRSWKADELEKYFGEFLPAETTIVLGDEDRYNTPPPDEPVREEKRRGCCC